VCKLAQRASWHNSASSYRLYAWVDGCALRQIGALLFVVTSVATGCLHSGNFHVQKHGHSQRLVHLCCQSVRGPLVSLKFWRNCHHCESADSRGTHDCHWRRCCFRRRCPNGVLWAMSNSVNLFMCQDIIEYLVFGRLLSCARGG